MVHLTETRKAQILRDYKTRQAAMHSPPYVQIAHVADKYQVPTATVRAIINEARKGVNIKWRVLKSPYKGMRKVVIKTLGGDISWHTDKDDGMIEAQIAKFKDRLDTGFC